MLAPVPCANCEQALAAESFVGNHGRCPKCGSSLTLVRAGLEYRTELQTPNQAVSAVAHTQIDSIAIPFRELLFFALKLSFASIPAIVVVKLVLLFADTVITGTAR
jgi:hypothetical protein